jgi:acetyl esterase/lipase
VSNGGGALRLVVGVLVAVLVPVGLGAGDAGAGVGVVERRDIEYARGVALDVFLPDEQGDLVPVVVLVHGGGWRSGDKDSWADEARMLVAGTGWAAVTVDYDLEAADPYVTQPANVRDAVAWIKTNAGDLGVDRDRIGLLGSSAGGHLAMLVATTTPGVKAVVSWSGISDMPRLVASPVGDQLVKDLAARYNSGRLDEHPERWLDSSPVAHVDAGDPPMFLAHSASETVVPVDQLNTMRDALRAVGVEVHTVVFPGDAHASNFAGRVWGRSIGFLRDHL